MKTTKYCFVGIFIVLVMFSAARLLALGPPEACRTGVQTHYRTYWKIEFVYTEGPNKGQTTFVAISEQQHKDLFPSRMVVKGELMWRQQINAAEIRFTGRQRV